MRKGRKRQSARPTSSRSSTSSLPPNAQVLQGSRISPHTKQDVVQVQTPVPVNPVFGRARRHCGKGKAASAKGSQHQHEATVQLSSLAKLAPGLGALAAATTSADLRRLSRTAPATATCRRGGAQVQTHRRRYSKIRVGCATSDGSPSPYANILAAYEAAKMMWLITN